MSSASIAGSRWQANLTALPDSQSRAAQARGPRFARWQVEQGMLYSACVLKHLSPTGGAARVRGFSDALMVNWRAGETLSGTTR